MGRSIFVLLLILSGYWQPSFAKTKISRKGTFYAYWGWNRSVYSRSDIRFRGADYDFVIEQVAAKDRQSPFGFDPYFIPGRVTIPQYNYRIGYYFSDAWDLSLGMDHMKYVVTAGQNVKLDGSIQMVESPYNGVYAHQEISLDPAFLQFEHTDGLNYLNAELRKSQLLIRMRRLTLSFLEGGGIGALIPRTDATLLGMERHDEFHFSGYGAALLIGLNAGIGQHFFLQTELKSGVINMPWIRTTASDSDRASQHFLFSQFNFSMGFRIGKSNYSIEALQKIN